MTKLVYSSHASKWEAETAIEDYFSTGEISECNRPTIEHKAGRYWVIILEAA